MITCDAAGCSATDTDKVVGIDLCKRCTRALTSHLAAWISDPAAQKQARTEQAARDAASEAARAKAEAEAAASLLEVQVQHVAKRQGFDPQLLRDKLTAGADLHGAVRGVLVDLQTAKLEADRIAAVRANAAHKKAAKAELAAKLKSGELDPEKHPIAHEMLVARAEGADEPAPEQK